MATMPKQKPGKSEQSVATPWNFLCAARNRLGIEQFSRDLAASPENAVTTPYFTEEDNALVHPWNNYDGWQWLNPPYADIGPWVSKAFFDTRKSAQIAVLVPAAVGANWWRDWVDGKAYITYLNGRITFVGHNTCYPKDLALLLYAPFLQGGSTIWRWK